MDYTGRLTYNSKFGDILFLRRIDQMADAGENDDEGHWEDASDAWTVLSEAGETDSEGTIEHSDGMSTVLGADPRRSGSLSLPYATPPLPPPRRHRTEQNSVVTNELSSVHPGARPRPPRKAAIRSRYDIEIDPDKNCVPKKERTFIKPPKLEGKDACVESHISQFEIIARRKC